MNLQNQNLMMPEGTASQDTENYQEAPSPSQQLRAQIESVNLAKGMDKDKLEDIGNLAKKGYESDKRSREQWEEDMKEWTKLAIQCREQKSYPWPKASNVKYPLLSTAAMQFAARAYPSLIPSDGKVVKCTVAGKDPTGEKLNRAERISTYMSYQLLKEMYSWEEDMDKMLIMLPVIGTMFKKTYFDRVDQKNCSKLVMPHNLVVNYWTKCLEDSERVSEIIEMSPRILKERQLADVFLDIDLDTPVAQNGKNLPEFDETTPYVLIEQHTYLDLDDDGYKEPYIVTFQESTGKVLRITARYDDKSIVTDESGKLVKIVPINYYTKFGFIPNPDGSFYDMGFGVLLGPLNESVNTLINQLIDAGSLSNLQSGFIGKGLRIKMGESRFQPGEWKAVNATADDLKKQILPLPVKEPSMVLFQLMGSLITSGKELASVAEIFVGKMPGQNTPATTTMATIEQGMKVFTAVYKRIYRSLAEEFKKLYRLNEVYLNPQTYAEIIDVQVGPNDFTYEGHDICPGADPTAMSQTEKLLKAQGLMELLPSGVLDPMKVVLRVLQAQEQPNIEELITPQAAETGQPQQQPDPKMLEMQMKGQAEEKKHALKQQEMAFKAELAARDQQFQQMMEQQRLDMEAQYKAMELRLKASADIHKQRIFEVQQNQKISQSERSHQQKMTHTAEQAKLKQEIAKSQPKQNSKSGHKTK
jgi:chaperonin GroES